MKDLDFFKHSIKDCDIQDQERLYRFRERFQCWSKWIGQNEIRKNTIKYQFVEIWNNEFSFQALNLVGEKTVAQTNISDFLAHNRAVSKFIIEGYLGFQYLAIRRLIDINKKTDNSKKGVKSIRRLLDDMKAHADLITREVFVCYDGLPYDYETEIKQQQEEWLAKLDIIEGSGVWSKSSNEDISMGRHSIFDRLSGANPGNRKRTDSIRQIYWEDLDKELTTPEINNIKNFTDKFIAHAADDDSVGTLEHEDKIYSIQKIRAAQDSLTKVFKQLTSDFWNSSLAMTPTYSASDLVVNFSKPFAPPEIITEVKEQIKTRMNSLLRVGAMDE